VISKSAVTEIKKALVAPRRAQITLEQLSFRGTLAADDLRALAWAKWFLHPYFHKSDAAPQWRVVLSQDNSLFAELSALDKTCQNRPIHAFLQHSPVPTPATAFQLDSLNILADISEQTYYIAAPEEKILLTVTQADNFRAPGNLMKAFREIACLDHQRNGAVILHAAAFEEAPGQATLVLAPKLGGKTTFLIGTLLGGAKLIANDRLVLHLRENNVIALGLPTIIALRTGTLDLFPEFSSEFSKRRFYFRRSFRNPNKLNRSSIGPSQFCQLANTTAISEASIRKILFLLTGAGPAKQLAAQEAAVLLKEAIFDFTDAANYFFAALHPVEPESFRRTAEQLCLQLARQAECWEYPREGKGKR
jgi:hypothetical protein